MWPNLQEFFCELSYATKQFNSNYLLLKAIKSNQWWQQRNKTYNLSCGNYDDGRNKKLGSSGHSSWKFLYFIRIGQMLWEKPSENRSQANRENASYIEVPCLRKCRWPTLRVILLQTQNSDKSRNRIWSLFQILATKISPNSIVTKSLLQRCHPVEW